MRDGGRDMSRTAACTPRDGARPFRGTRGVPLLLAGFDGCAGGVVAAQTIEDKAQLCNACHGEDGIPQDKTIPVIWGQHQGYTYLQLRDYKRGARKNDHMSPIAETLERDDMMALADYFAKKPWPDLSSRPAPAPASGAGAAGQCRGRLHGLSSGGISGRRHAAAARRPDQGISGQLDDGFPHRRARQQSRE